MNYFYRNQNLSEHGDSVALIEGNTEVTYRDLAKRVEEKSTIIQTAVELASNKLALTSAASSQQAKHLVGMIADNSVASVVNYLALLSLNYPILFLTQAQLDAHQNNVAGDRATDDQLNVFETYQLRFVLHEDHVYTLQPSTHFDDNEVRASLPTIQNNIALLLSTSGSTGASKQVVLSYDNLQANCDSICAYLPIEKSDVTITTLPFNYSYGLSIINTHLAVGATIVLTTLSVMQREFWQVFERHSVTSFGGVPHSYEMLLRLRFTSMVLPSLNYFTQAGGKLSSDRVRQLASYAKENQKSFFVMYGQTEATARMAYADHDKLLAKPETIGKAIPNTELKLEDGELVFTGDNVMLGYAHALSDLISMQGLSALRTGDLAYQDEDGDFFITGRTKRIVKLFGERLSLDALQSDLFNVARSGNSCNLIENVYCVGNDKCLHIAVLQCTSAMQNEAELALIIQKLKQHMRSLNIHASALKYHIINTSPLNSNGKIDYPVLLADLQSENLARTRATDSTGDES